ncbi:MAG: spermidine synthase [Sphingomonadales bacterium RIFCSPHIGHO2_01_FULL_65_20]|jgi:spermidine synthase|uniref:spermine/spermidine synthase domain-containing protein n=1 Tax=unclassified Blastomonas TaxID=2626550 RepID=UPI000833A25D|nr:spermidine synthase [Blastomonas sp.]MCH2237806.1 MnmC family methyltransferase [Blastomonas sp.]OHC97218.1 MAG: spermidine synthase [Sphingomonadales bacterium RIFCSPHIGHO2_01_FULL_65_20]
MIPRELLATAEVPGGDEPLRLIRRGSEYSIMLGANELMNSRLSGSEEAMSTLAAARIAGVSAPRVLIGGLGMGFTLRTALQAFGARASIEVAELVPEIVDWARGPMAHLHAGTLDDPRVSIHVGDVGGLIRSSAGRFDAILLDVDNGPDGLSREGNDALYTAQGLQQARAALGPGGVLAVWSSGPDPRFTSRLRKAGFAVEEEVVRARRTGGGARHTIWLAQRR